MQVEIDGNLIEVVIVYKDNKNIYFRFKDDGKLYVYCSRWVSEASIKKIIKKNEKSLSKMLTRNNKSLDNQQYFYYLGKKYIVVFSDIDGVLLDDGYVFVKNREKLEKFYRQECQRIFTKRVREFQELIKDVPDFSLRIRKMKTRWGVNNVSKRIITLNSELLKYDFDLLDYVIVHEMCHFYEANHSKFFWQHVEEYYPKYKLARKRLREGL